MEDLTGQEIYIKLNDIYINSEDKIKTNALVSRAYIDKISSDTISEKVDAQLNSIKVGIKQINSKFKEGSKNYDSTKELITHTMSNYKQALIDLSEFYDGKIEQLILRKVELEASLIGAILNDKYLEHNILKKNEEKNNDNMKMSLKDNIKIAIEKIKNRKKEKSQVDMNILSKVIDGQDIEREIDQKNTSRVEKIVEIRKENKEFISKTEKEISLINSEIDRLNEQKKNAIYDAMEVGNKSVSATIRKPKLFNQITRFFVAKFNTAKFVETTIIEPFNLRIENFKNNELANMKG